MPARLHLIWPSHCSSIIPTTLSFAFMHAAAAPLVYIHASGPLHMQLLSGMLFSQVARWFVSWSFSWFFSNVTFSLGPFLHAVYLSLQTSPLSSIPFPALFDAPQLAPSSTLVSLFTVFLLPLENKLCKSRDFFDVLFTCLWEQCWAQSGYSLNIC